jgi:hypothetical protein
MSVVPSYAGPNSAPIAGPTSGIEIRQTRPKRNVTERKTTAVYWKSSPRAMRGKRLTATTVGIRWMPSASATATE